MKRWWGCDSWVRYLHDVLDERGPAGQLVRLLADPLLAVGLLGLLGDSLRTTAFYLIPL